MQGYQTSQAAGKTPCGINQDVGRKDSTISSSAVRRLFHIWRPATEGAEDVARPHAVGDTLVSPTTPALARCAKAAPRERQKPCKGFQARAWPPQCSAAARLLSRQASEDRKGTLDWVEHRENHNPKRSGGSRGRED